MAKKKKIVIERNEGWKKLSGALPVSMTNDYLFKALLQSDNETLQALIASLLGIDRSEIREAKIENPIMLGETVTEKDFILDARVLLNRDSNLDIEMQVVHEKGWEERSISYLSRMYVELNKGQKYTEAKAAIQIGILDFTPNADNAEFYSVNMLTDQKTHRVYSEKYQLRYVDLTKIDKATEEEQNSGLVAWARMFRAKTWEELKMLAEKNQDIDSAVSYVYPLTEEWLVREQMIRREEFLINQQADKDTIKQQDREIRELEEKLQERDEQLQEKDEQIQDLRGTLQEKDELIAHLLAQSKQKE